MRDGRREREKEEGERGKERERGREVKKKAAPCLCQKRESFFSMMTVTWQKRIRKKRGQISTNVSLLCGSSFHVR